MDKNKAQILVDFLGTMLYLAEQTHFIFEAFYPRYLAILEGDCQKDVKSELDLLHSQMDTYMNTIERYGAYVSENEGVKAVVIVASEIESESEKELMN